MTGWWFSPGTTVPSTNKTDRYDITEILLKLALNTLNHKLTGFVHYSIITSLHICLQYITGGYFNAHIPPYLEWLKYFSIIHYAYASLHILCTEDLSFLWYVTLKNTQLKNEHDLPK